MQEPLITVGILSAAEINFSLSGEFRCANGIKTSGAQQAVYQNGAIVWQGERYSELTFVPTHQEEAYFELKEVIIGVNFHWERKEDQQFRGALKLIVEEERLTAINVVGIEEYLTSVISSEMSATASLELLKAHAVISRGWLLHKIEESKRSYNESLLITARAKAEQVESYSQRIKWYDHQAHTRFNVCADDHCQRYQGITRASSPQVVAAVSATRGQVLTYQGEVCDTRFSKCCGGALEEFQNCWENVKHPYLIARRDSKTETQLPDLTLTSEADLWIRSAPDAFCNTQDKKILSQVLNNYDQETTDFYRWRVSYSQQELSELINSRLGIDFGEIIDLIPVERGTSGRLIRLQIVGTLRTLTLGKELEIRRALSSSHLYSSAFVIDKAYTAPSTAIPSSFTLIGAGWGHGVGLCQIGAAMMGSQGYPYQEILAHYYPQSKLETHYV